MTNKKLLLVFIAVMPALAPAKMSTAEKIAVSAGAAGLALSACYLADALETLDAHGVTWPQYTWPDELLDEVRYKTTRIKHHYAYELELASRYEITASWRSRERIEEELIMYIRRGGSVSSYRHHITNKVIPELIQLRRTLEKKLDTLIWGHTRYTYKEIEAGKTHCMHIATLIDQLDIIVEIIDNGMRQTYHREYKKLYR